MGHYACDFSCPTCGELYSRCCCVREETDMTPEEYEEAVKEAWMKAIDKIMEKK